MRMQSHTSYTEACFLKKIYVEEAFDLMNLSKHKRWRALKVIAKQQ